ncbi:hypothetical protein F4778DRAFT_385410 [Xylariomycetidae sp. FL2044]|nr:hypothetical protein F4778DRAFT_385410 [Xylariomycetidae sp. FL2044]
MPMLQVTSSDSVRLQEVADSLGKARKMVIVTGAGISTNSGIPDFRSENGLYSLIQAQFERAEASEERPDAEEASDYDIGERSAKRRRISRPDNNSPASARVKTARDQTVGPAIPGCHQNTSVPLDEWSPAQEVSVIAAPSMIASPEELSRRMTRSQATSVRPSVPRHLTDNSEQSSTSQASLFSTPQSASSSCSQTDDSIICGVPELEEIETSPSTPKNPSHTRTFPSSPLSSPPPVLFDPYENNAVTDSSSQPGSVCSGGSELSDAQQPPDFLSSQTSNSSLRNMKGRDLFDCNIWADPLKTSVFYRFATTLRQKVKEVEPTMTHRFIAQMRDVGKLARVYTQNIDEIEKKIGLSTDLKSGAGNKRRKSTKQQLINQEKESQDSADQQPKTEDDPGGQDTGPAFPVSDDATPNKVRQNLVQDKGVECVFLHGSLQSLRCFVCGKLCDWDEDGRESCTLSGEQPECPHCAGATAARQEKGKRALGVGKLRPDIVLYGEEHPQSDLISPIVQHDLSAGPDLLLILGTSLRVHGLKTMVKEFAKAVHSKGGKVVFINFTKPSESAWGDVIDYWIEWDCDAWVGDLKGRKPRLWLSPEELQTLEQQRRDALAERKEILSKKRESLHSRKNEVIDGEKALAADETSKMHDTIEVSKPRPPPKNPCSMRNDYGCGAYVTWDILQTLAKIGGRPFDNLGYTPPEMPEVDVPKPEPEPEPVSKVSSKSVSRHTSKPAVKDVKAAKALKTVKAVAGKVKVVTGEAQPLKAVKAVKAVKIVKAVAKKPRKSAPAVLPSANLDRKSRPAVKASFLAGNDTGKDQYTKAAKELARASKPSTPARLAILNQAPPKEEQRTTASPKTAPDSVSAAVKTNPRKRKPKAIFDGVEATKSRVRNRASSNQVSAGGDVVGTPRPEHMSPVHNDPLDDASIHEVPIQIATIHPRGPPLPPLQANWEKTPPVRIEPLEPNLVVSPESPLATSHKRLETYSWWDTRFPMRHVDPLVGLPYNTNYNRGPNTEPILREEHTPSPSDQLRREWEVADAADTLSRMRHGF